MSGSLIVENTYVGPFLILKRLGNNRRQRVFHARQTEQNRDVALKFISIPPDVDWNVALDKIDLEVSELQKLRHPNLVKVFGAGVHEDQVFFATELVEGESLASLLTRRGKLAPDLVVEYGRQLAEVLEYLNSHNLIHSKLTPDKILITADHKVKLSDLRLNRAKKRRWDSNRLRELDIAAYMAPEQFSDGATAKSDYYSLGVILYEMLSGRLPYELDNMGRMAKLKLNTPAPSIASEVIGCPIWLDKIVTQLLQADPRKRPHSAKAIALAFEEIRKLDASQESTASQIVGKFNALNAGVDKTEARQVLSKRKKQQQSEDSIFQTIPFLIGGLLLIVSFLTFMLWPEGVEKRLERMKEMVHSDSPEAWSEARVVLKELRGLRANDSEKMIAQQASELYDLARRKTLIYRAESKRSNTLQSENVKTFSTAFALEEAEKFIEAIAKYQQLIDTIPKGDDDYYIVQAAVERMQDLQGRVTIPDDVDQLTAMINLLAAGQSAAEIKQNNDILGRIIIKFAGDDQFVEIVNQAKQVLEANRTRASNLRESD